MARSRIAIQAVRARGISSGLIAWWGNGWNGYSHGDALLRDGSLLGARSDKIRMHDGTVCLPGIRVRPPGYDRWVRQTIYWKDVDDSVADRWEYLLGECLGDEYDKPGIWRLLVDKQPVVDGWWFCSAYLNDRLQQLGEFPADLSKPSQQVTPDDLAFGLSLIGWNRQEMIT